MSNIFLFSLFAVMAGRQAESNTRSFEWVSLLYYCSMVTILNLFGLPAYRETVRPVIVVVAD
ncbi:MAG TPA: hypothetical protein DCY55_10005 [Gammaproteobacteria bacterium]|nr:hypothetical protein [Gammaproteobacteria bacterium]